MLFEQLGLIEPIMKALKTEGYTQPTPIQEQSIPEVLQGKDLLGCAQTGTGKTAAFIIPILEKLEVISKPQVLILVPTRELALQVSEEARKLSPHNNLQVAAVYGGEPIYKQLQAFRRGVDVIIGTPGRIIDHTSCREETADQGTHSLLADKVGERRLLRLFSIPAWRDFFCIS